jgi:hypothetical protein
MTDWPLQGGWKACRFSNNDMVVNNTIVCYDAYIGNA